MSAPHLRWAAGALLAGALGYLALWPVPIRPVAWPAATPPGYVGDFAPNTRLANLRHIDTGDEIGPEHIAFGPDGRLYAAMTGGNLIRMQPDGSRRERFANTGGRVLGFAFDAVGRMIAADAMKRLLECSCSRQGPPCRPRERRAPASPFLGPYTKTYVNAYEAPRGSNFPMRP